MSRETDPNHSFSNIEKEIKFQYINLVLDAGAGVKMEREILPHMIIENNRGSIMYFISTKVRSGNLEIAGQKFTAYLGHSNSIGPSFDWQGTTLLLVPEDKTIATPRWRGGYNIKAIHRIPDTDSGIFYSFSTTPRGDQLFVHPYTGDLGIFEIGPGNRKLDKMEVAGSLTSRDAYVAGRVEGRSGVYGF